MSKLITRRRLRSGRTDSVLLSDLPLSVAAYKKEVKSLSLFIQESGKRNQRKSCNENLLTHKNHKLQNRLS